MKCAACGYDDALYYEVKKQMDAIPMKTRLQRLKNAKAVASLGAVFVKLNPFKEVMHTTGGDNRARIVACPVCFTMKWQE